MSSSARRGKRAERREKREERREKRERIQWVTRPSEGRGKRAEKREKRDERREQTSTTKISRSKDAMVRSQGGGMVQKGFGP